VAEFGGAVAEFLYSDAFENFNRVADLAKAKSSAKKSTCLSNVRQIGLAYQSFLIDHDDRFPASVSKHTAPPGTPDTASSNT
jgi:hypothetical protein